MLYLKADGAAVPWDGRHINDVRYPRSVEWLWTAPQLGAIGLYRPEPPDPIPEGKRSTGQTVQIVAGVVKVVHALEDIPAPTPADFPLTMRQLRLGLFLNGYSEDFILDTVNAMTDPAQKGVAKIWYEETSQVLWEHEMTQALIAATGISPEAATVMWLQAKDLAA